MPLLIRGPLINLPVVLATDYPPIQVVCIAVILTVMMLMHMLSWPWKVPLLNLTDCIISFCIVLLVTTATLFLQTVGGTMYAFAHAISTAMLGGIGLAVGIMVFMTASALVYRSALGGKKELQMFNLGRTPTTPELAIKIKEMAAALEDMNVDSLSANLAAMSVFDVGKVSPPAADSSTFKFNKRIASHSFDPNLRVRPQSFRGSTSRASFHDKPAENNETNDTLELVEPEPAEPVKLVKPGKSEVMRTQWI